MIFLTVGSELPFNRLVNAVDEWAKTNNRDDIIGQIADPGPNGCRPKHIQCYNFISAEEYERYFDEAELIISHAGMGSIITAMLKKKSIIIMPRRAELKETRNNHQVATARRFRDHKGIMVAEDESEIGELLGKWKKSLYPQTSNIGEYAEESLLQEIRNFIMNA
jgi:UDP-N-acetylglucosamine transferase subunit ALG13